MASEPLSSLSEEELVKKATRAVFAGFRAAFDCEDLARLALDAIDLSSILERLERALAVAEKFEKEAREWKARLEAAEGERDQWKSQALAGSQQYDNLRGERDRLREAASEALDLIVGAWVLSSWVQIAERHEKATALLRAALSTGDRQEQHFGGTGAEVAQTGLDGHKSEGGST